jgi:hypothetical protein
MVLAKLRSSGARVTIFGIVDVLAVRCGTCSDTTTLECEGINVWGYGIVFIRSTLERT